MKIKVFDHTWLELRFNFPYRMTSLKTYKVDLSALPHEN